VIEYHDIYIDETTKIEDVKQKTAFDISEA